MSDSWLMFHHDERHTGLAHGVGRIPPFGPVTRKWVKRVAPPVTEATLSCYRFYSGFPLVQLDGHGGLDVIVTGPDNTCHPNGVPNLTQGNVRAIRTLTNPLRAEFLWDKSYGTVNPSSWACSDWFDQYSAAAVPRGSEPPDIIFTSKLGIVRAVNGLTGHLIWADDTRRFIEAGPMVADVDGDGQLEIIVVTGIPPEVPSGREFNPCQQQSNSALLIYKARPHGGGQANPPIRVINSGNTRDFPAEKLDSMEPAIVDLNPPGRRNSKTIVFGGWDGNLYAVWFDLETNNRHLATAVVKVNKISMADVARDTGNTLSDIEQKPVIRSSPLIWDFGQGYGETAVFAWMGNYDDIESSRISAVGLSFHNDADPNRRKVIFTPRWTKQRVSIDGEDWSVMDWKPSIALLPIQGAPPLVVSAGGQGISRDEAAGIPGEGGVTGNYGRCSSNARGWVGAFDRDGNLVWGKKYVGEGNIRASCAVADLDGDGHYEVVVPFGCYGKLRCCGYDEVRREWGERWDFQLGDLSMPATQETEATKRSIASPSIGDVDGDGFLEIIVSAFDGKVYCLGGA